MSTTRAHLHRPLPPDRAALWSRFLSWDVRYFPNVVGLEAEEILTDYARLRLRYREELQQPAGVVHGGAIATLIDTVVVPAVGGAYDAVPLMLTIDLQIRFLSAARGEDLVAEGWITKRGRSTVFCQAEVRGGTSDEVIAEGWLVYKVSPPKPAVDS
jgi:uncharacterized protein (TIGR00369 family)